MPSPKSGSAGTAVSPAEPAEAQEADVADPGVVEEIKAEQREQNAGKYAPNPAPPFKPDEAKTGWIEIELIGEDDKPIPGERYLVTLPNGNVAGGTLDEKGLARIEGFDSGTCKVSFPRLDEEAWEPA